MAVAEAVEYSPSAPKVQCYSVEDRMPAGPIGTNTSASAREHHSLRW